MKLFLQGAPALPEFGLFLFDLCQFFLCGRLGTPFGGRFGFLSGLLFPRAVFLGLGDFPFLAGRYFGVAGLSGSAL